ncbi:MAG: hypothetical protein WD468_05090 [Pirellulales bacterium]
MTRSVQFIYLEVEEEGTLRRSFDLNIYAAGLRVAQVADVLEQAALEYGLSAVELERLLALIGGLRLGHIAGGTDRRGDDFLTIYYESDVASQ